LYREMIENFDNCIKCNLKRCEKICRYYLNKEEVLKIINGEEKREAEIRDGKYLNKKGRILKNNKRGRKYRCVLKRIGK